MSKDIYNFIKEQMTGVCVYNACDTLIITLDGETVFEAYKIDEYDEDFNDFDNFGDFFKNLFDEL